MEDLINDLKASLPLHLYGIGNAKSFDSLVKEIQSKESIIKFYNGTFTRILNVAKVEVYYAGKILVESRQILKAGNRERVRNIKGLSEKLIGEELPINGARRAVQEELGLDVSHFHFLETGNEVDLSFSPSYPGLPTIYHFFNFNTIMPWYFYQDEYVEDGETAITYFSWEEKR
jgi:hypothetical protein